MTRLHGGAVPDVDDMSRCRHVVRAAQRGRDVVAATRLDVDDGDGGALGRERRDRPPSDPAGAAGDHDGPALEAVRSGHGGLLTFS